jgi:hypothetical protein
MALTDVQKMELDAILSKKLVNMVGHGDYTLADIRNLLIGDVDFDLKVQSLPSCIDRVFSKEKKYQLHRSYYNSKNMYKVTLPITLKKEKNLLHYCGTPDDLYYNFADGSFSADSPLVDSGSLGYVKELLPYEWIFNYCTDIDKLRNIALLDKKYYEKMPTGFYNYLKEKDYSLTAKTLRNYVLHQKYGKYTLFYERLADEMGEYRLDKLVDKIKIENLYKVFNNSLMNCEIFDMSPYSISNALQVFYAGVCNFNYPIDINRGIDYNKSCINSFLNENRARIIEDNMKKLNFINGLEINDYVIVVPQTMEDKAEEGRMQHNCVGSFYDDSILQGRNAIYFIRKKENPNHSYITCRYNYQERNTVEARKVNNSSIRNDNEWEMIRNISKIINEYFDTHKE